METETTSLQIPCPFHPSEMIQRVAMDKNADHDVYCLECVLQQKSNPKRASQTLKPISEFIDTAISLYAKKRENANFADQVPCEMTEILTRQPEKLEALTQHIEEEKKRVSEVFDLISEELLKIIEEKKAEAFSQLDQQTSNLRFWYLSFDKELKKAYPTAQDIPVLYPTREDLLNKLTNITNATQLSALVKDIRDDINEAPIDLKRKATMNIMSKQLLEIAEMRSSYKTEALDLLKLKGALRNEVSKLMNQTWNLQNPIPEVVTGLTTESAFLKAQDFSLLKS